MEKTLSAVTLSAAVAATLLMPVSAFAYLSPDQVFNSPGQDATHAAAPDNSATVQPDQVQSDQVTKRSAPDVVIQQQQSDAAARAGAQKNLQPVDAPPADTFVAPTQSLGLFDQNAQYDKRQNRIQNEKSSGPTIIIGGNGDVVDANGNVLHSGAPRVTSTGPETILAMLAIVLAMICTFGYAHIRGRMAGAAMSV